MGSSPSERMYCWKCIPWVR